jgi:hypothetical protein
VTCAEREKHHKEEIGGDETHDFDTSWTLFLHAVARDSAFIAVFCPHLRLARRLGSVL